MYRNTFLSVMFLACCFNGSLCAQSDAQIYERTCDAKTYPFSDPSPVATPNNSYYPYFRFDGFSMQAQEKQWKMVVLENDYVKLTVTPEIGGKIWGAIDKVNNKEFVYTNGVVKFRDVAMRGPWTSGGIEFNFGIIGHAPTCSTPIDYLTKKNVDGSVSCHIFSYEWITRTVWNVEISLPKDKAYFTTHTTWFNQSSIDQPYYQWMNAGYATKTGTRFYYPGTYSIGHSGDLHPYPIDEEGRDVSWYDNNNFGASKSLHIIGDYNDYFGIYWHNEKHGSAHYSNYDEKLGMKFYLWSFSREGAIWEELLTDDSGQYAELQSGRMYNQPSVTSGFTPFNHNEFAAQMTDQWTEYWFPIAEIGGLSQASPLGAIYVEHSEKNIEVHLSALKDICTDMEIYNDRQLLMKMPIKAKILTPEYFNIPLPFDIPEGKLRIIIGNKELVYSEIKNDYELNRPKELPADFDWNSTYGLYMQGKDWLNQKMYGNAEKYLKAALEKDVYFIPALVSLSSLYYKKGMYLDACELVKRVLSLDTYHGEANYLYGLCSRAMGNLADAKDGFSVATFSPGFRTAAYEQLGELYMREENWEKAEQYALKSLEYNQMNLYAKQLLIVLYRKSNHAEKALSEIEKMTEQLPLLHWVRFEEYLLEASTAEEFSSLICNELSFETYMEMAVWYESIGCLDEAITLLSFVDTYPIALYQKAYIYHLKGDEKGAMVFLDEANKKSPKMVFPFRAHTLNVLEWAAGLSDNWKISYYRGLIQWSVGNTCCALNLLNSCKDVPDYAAFYLSRAELRKDKSGLPDLLMAQKLDQSWRTQYYLLNYYVDHEQWAEAVKVGRNAYKRYPDNYYIGLKYAMALCESGQYMASLNCLKKLQVLPYEGSYIGRDIYRRACLYQAMKEWEDGRYAKMLTMIEKTQEWPENLGVGKPDEELIDTRLEDYMAAIAYVEQGQSMQADKLFSQIASSNMSEAYFDSNNLLVVLALRNLGKVDMADSLVNEWKVKHVHNEIAQWCILVYNNEKKKATEILNKYEETEEIAPWNVGYRDYNFKLIRKLSRILKK